MIWLKKAAANGYAKAHKMIWPFAYGCGKQVGNNYAEALQTYKKFFLANNKEEANDADICKEIGDKYAYCDSDGEDEFLEEDSQSSIEWYLLAANQGSIAAQIKLAEIYYDGEDGVEEDTKKAHEWYLKAANQGSMIAQFKLGYMYYYGKGVTRDYKEAFTWHFKGSAPSSCLFSM